MMLSQKRAQRVNRRGRWPGSCGVDGRFNDADALLFIDDLFKFMEISMK
jgi:hypothetical protein